MSTTRLFLFLMALSLSTCAGGGAPTTIQGNTYNITCDQDTLQSYMTNTIQDGDTILCSAGSFTYNSRISLRGAQTTTCDTAANTNYPAVYIDKAVTLVGAGYNLSTGQTTTHKTTIIDNTCNFNNTQYRDSVAMKVTGVAGKKTRIAGFDFEGRSDTAGGVIRVQGPGQSYDSNGDHFPETWKLFRFDHNETHVLPPLGVDASGDASVGAWGVTLYGVYGVIDHNTFDQGDYGGANCIEVYGAYPNPYVNRNYVLANPAGTANAVYIENNLFTGSNLVDKSAGFDCSGGGQFVARYNNFWNTGIQVHGNENTGLRGCRHYEIYGNTFNTDPADAAHSKAVYLRAGTGVIYDNTINGNYNNPVMMTNYRTWNTDKTSYNEWGLCDGTSTCDGNTDSFGYPCMSQIGRITDTNVGSDGNYPVAYYQNACYKNNTVPTGGSGPAQTSAEPLRAWHNKFQSSNYTTILTVESKCSASTGFCNTDVIKSGRDYIDSAGTLDAMKPGYTPFQYPHPLVGVAAH